MLTSSPASRESPLLLLNESAPWEKIIKMTGCTGTAKRGRGNLPEAKNEQGPDPQPFDRSSGILVSDEPCLVLTLGEYGSKQDSSIRSRS